METFVTFLEKRVDDSSSLLCIGLDPHVSDLPEPTAAAAQEFCLRLVKATARYAAAFKPNAAFFEALGPEGWAVLGRVIAAIADESGRLGSKIPVILDAKRGDIASTAEAYARSTFEVLRADAITLSPYLGHDSIEPFLTYRERGVFLLCKTSNPGAGDLQDVMVTADHGPRNAAHQTSSVVHGPSSIPLYEHVAHLAKEWNTGNNIGLVVGATQLEALARVRTAAPDLWFLSPGVGTQGADLESALRAGLRKDGRGMLVNVSRSLARASDPASAAAELRDQVVNVKLSLNGAGK